MAQASRLPLSCPGHGIPPQLLERADRGLGEGEGFMGERQRADRGLGEGEDFLGERKVAECSRRGPAIPAQAGCSHGVAENTRMGELQVPR